MKLQIAFDMTDLDKALGIAKDIAEYADILEIGTLLIYKHGTTAIEKFRETFPKKHILADSKIVDRGKEAAQLFSQAGADWITVMAGTGKDVIHAVCTTAHANNTKVMLDLIDASTLGQSALEAKNLGIDALLFHQPYDEKESLTFLDKWDMIKGNTNLPIFVSAKFTPETLPQIIAINPAGIVLGRTITDADNPAEEIVLFHDQISKGA